MPCKLPTCVLSAVLHWRISRPAVASHLNVSQIANQVVQCNTTSLSSRCAAGWQPSAGWEG